MAVSSFPYANMSHGGVSLPGIVKLVNRNFTAAGFNPKGAVFQNNGDLSTLGTPSSVPAADEWHDVQAVGIGAAYELISNKSGGSATMPTDGVWSNLGTTRSITCGPSDTWNGTIQIRPAGGGAVLDTCTINLS